jgi:hypothetical protein
MAKRRRGAVVPTVPPAPGTSIVRLERSSPAYQALVGALAKLALADARRRQAADPKPPTRKRGADADHSEQGDDDDHAHQDTHSRR